MASGYRPSIEFSQNFLKSRRLAERLVERANVYPNDTVIEIGPGKGVLTRALARRCQQVIAVEKDTQLASRLRTRLDYYQNMTIFEADFLDLPLPVTPYKVFANIPFNITADIVRKLTDAPNPPDDTYVFVQREAAQRFLGHPRGTLISALLQPWFELSVEHHFRNVDFVPPPRVDIVLLRFNKRGPPLVASSQAQLFRDFVVHGFTAWQPTMREAYAGVFEPADFNRFSQDFGLDAACKPSDVQPALWINLFAQFHAYGSPAARATMDGAQSRLTEQQSGLQKVRRSRTAVGPQRESPAPPRSRG